MYDRLLSLTESLQQLCSKLQDLQSQRIALRNLTLEIESLEPRRHSPIRPALTKSKASSTIQQTNTDIKTTQETMPALYTLLDHLSLPSHDSTMKLQGAPTQIKSSTAELHLQSTAHIDRILSISEQAASTRLELLDTLARCLSDSSRQANGGGITGLEDSINKLRIEMGGIV